MARVQYSNNAQSVFVSTLTASATSLTLGANEGIKYPALDNDGDWHPLHLVKQDGSDFEIVRVTERANDTLTIVRAQEGTSALSFVANDLIWLGTTKAFFDAFVVSGIDTTTILQGTNFAESVPTATDRYTVTVNGITAYSDNLELAIMPHRSNTTTTLIVNLNQLGDKAVVLPDGTDPHVNAVLSTRQAHVRFDLANDRFVLQNAVPKAVSQATVTSQGVVQLTGAAVPDNAGSTTLVPHYQSVSKIAEAAAAAAVAQAGVREAVPFIWSNLGNGAGGNFSPTSDFTLQSNRAHQYNDFTVGAGVTMTCGRAGVMIIRGTGKLTLSPGSTIIGPRAHRGNHYDVVGPTGAVSSLLVGARRMSFPNPQVGYRTSTFRDQGLSLEKAVFDKCVLSGMEMEAFHGGAGDISAGDVSDNFISDSYGRAGGGGLIFIFNEIEVQANADITNLYSLPEEVFTASFPKFGASAGGMVVFAARNGVTIDASAQFELGLQGEQRTFSEWEGRAFDNAPAANGHVFVIDFSNSSYSSLRLC